MPFPRFLLPLYHWLKWQCARHPGFFRFLLAIKQRIRFRYPESRLAHEYLDGLKGIEIGASAFNRFGLDTLNVNFTADDDTLFAHAETRITGERVRVDVVAFGDRLPFADDAWDFVLASHVIEHFQDPIAALFEWYRIVRPGGYLFLMVPHKERTFDREKPRTTLQELIARHERKILNVPTAEHCSVWVAGDFIELCAYLKLPVVRMQDPDDKTGNGFTVVIRKP